MDKVEEILKSYNLLSKKEKRRYRKEFSNLQLRTVIPQEKKDLLKDKLSKLVDKNGNLHFTESFLTEKFK